MHFHPLKKRKKKECYGELSFLYIYIYIQVSLKSHTIKLISTAIYRGKEPWLRSILPNPMTYRSLQFLSLSLSHSLSILILFYKSFPCFVWLLRKYTIIEEQDFRNFSYGPKSWQLNRVLAVEYYKKHGVFFSWDNMVLMIFFFFFLP